MLVDDIELLVVVVVVSLVVVVDVVDVELVEDDVPNRKDTHVVITTRSYVCLLVELVLELVVLVDDVELVLEVDVVSVVVVLDVVDVELVEDEVPTTSSDFGDRFEEEHLLT